MHDESVEQVGDCGNTDMPMRTHLYSLAGLKSAGPIWSKKTNGPTIRRSGAGSARATENSPRSLSEGRTIRSTKPLEAAQAGA